MLVFYFNFCTPLVEDRYLCSILYSSSKMNNNLKAKGLVLRAGEKNLRDNVPIRFNDWAVLGGPKKDTADVTKTSLIKFSVLTHNHGVGGKATSRDC